MQKKLIALAIAGLSSTAFAQSNVTISGVLKGGYDSTKISGGVPAAARGSMNQFSDQASNLIFKGSEGLGNGLSAIFQIDARFGIDGVDNSSTNNQGVGGFATGNTHVGLKSASFGEFKLGTQDLHYNETERIEGGAKSLSQQSLVGRSLLSQIGGAGNTVAPDATRAKNVLFWDSPNWSGFTARVAYSTNDRADELNTTTNSVGTTAGTANSLNVGSEQGSAWNLVGRYENGPIKAGVSYYDREADAAINTIAAQGKSTKVWAGYTIAGFSFGLAYDQSKNEYTTAGTFDKRDAWAIPLSYAFGNHGFFATYARANDVKDETGKVNDSDASMYTLGYSYDLSKRTSVGVNYSKISNGTNSNYTFGNVKSFSPASTGGQDISQLYAGIRHAF